MAYKKEPDKKNVEWYGTEIMRPNRENHPVSVLL
jgi:hypothetical protein